jgi:hypothetical protein
MEEAANETVIIVHGTYAAPRPGVSRWYQPTEGFVTKLNDALQKRGSAARCWAHCAQGNPIFQWSGNNSWIDRTHAASALGNYVAKLRKEGWRCHIVAHSHGGNVVVEALPQIIAAPGPNGTIVTLGSPFMDTMSPILERARRARRILDVVSWIGFAIIMCALAIFILVMAIKGGIGLYLSLPIVALILSVTLVARQWFGRTHSTAQVWPPFHAIGSLRDEAWQVLHHVRLSSQIRLVIY